MAVADRSSHQEPVGPSAAGGQATACRFCGGDSTAAFSAWDRNRRRSDERFPYRRCRECGTLFLARVPEDLGLYYGGAYYDFDETGEARWRSDPFLLGVERERMRILAEHVSEGRLIEVGSGAGCFASAAHDVGFDVTAIEMDRRCCEHLQRRVGVRALCSDRPSEVIATLEEADVVAMWHSLEHLPDPGAMVDAACERVRPGGVLAIGVPNPSSLQARLLRRRWAHLDAPRHLSLVPVDALLARAASFGLEPVVVRTDDEFGRHCNRHGWAAALVRRPDRGIPPRAHLAAALIARALAPIEGRRLRGSAALIVLRRGS